MTDIQITTQDNGRLAVTSPYNADYVAGAKDIGGRWDGANRQWTFDPRDEERLRELLRDVYGTDGSPADQADLVTVRWNITGQGVSRGDNELYFAGRVVASRRSRDDTVRLGPNVILISGGFDYSGGSMRYPSLSPEEGTVIEIRDVPRSAVTGTGAEIVGETIDIDALLAKREQLLAQLAELDETLAAHGHTVATDDDGQASRSIPAGQAAGGVITITIPVADADVPGLSTAAYAGHAGVSPRTVRRWAASGRVAATRTSSGWIISA